MVDTPTLAQLPHRHYVAWGWLASTTAIVALAVGTVAVTTSEASVPDQGATTSGPNAGRDLPDGYPAAPLMTKAAWEQVDDTWDVFSVSGAEGGGTPRLDGSLAVYVNPQGGERRLAFASDDLPDTTLRAIAWDPDTLFMLLSTAAREFRVLDMRTGTYTELAAPIDGQIAQIQGLGRASDGRSYIEITPGASSDGPVVVAAWDGGGWEDVDDQGFGAVSQLSGDTAIAWDHDTLVAYDVVTTVTSQPLLAQGGCAFHSWATATDFAAHCVMGDEAAIRTVGVSLEGGDTQELGPWHPAGPIMSGVPTTIPGTPLVVESQGDIFAVSVLTDAGVHAVGTIQSGDAPWHVSLAADSRWVLMSTSRFLYVVDTRRGTLDYLGAGFAITPQDVAFLPGSRG